MLGFQLPNDSQHSYIILKQALQKVCNYDLLFDGFEYNALALLENYRKIWFERIIHNNDQSRDNHLLPLSDESNGSRHNYVDWDETEINRAITEVSYAPWAPQMMPLFQGCHTMKSTYLLQEYVEFFDRTCF